MLLSLEKAIFSWLHHYVGEKRIGTKTAEYICMRLVKLSVLKCPPSVSPCAQMLRNLEAKVAKKMQHHMSNSIIFCDKIRGTKRQEESWETLVGKLVALGFATAWRSVWNYFFCTRFHSEQNFMTLKFPPRSTAFGRRYSPHQYFPSEMESFDRVTHTFPLLWKVNSLPGHKRKFPIATFVLPAVGTWSGCGSLGTAVMQIIPPLLQDWLNAVSQVLTAWCQYSQMILAAAQTDTSLSSVALVCCCQDGWRLLGAGFVLFLSLCETI